MTSIAATMSASLNNVAKRAVYSTSQIARIMWYTGLYAYGRRKMGPLTEPGEAPYADEFAPLDRVRLAKSFRELFQADWRNIKQGQYKLPVEMRRPMSPIKFWRRSVDYLRDAEKVSRRKHNKEHSEVLSKDITEDKRGQYPRYYLQNFHFQTGGWFSDDSAERYDMQVETLFTGAGHAMRRQALPHIRAAFKDRNLQDLHFMDMACGAGSFLAAIKDNFPDLQVTALDLSPTYLAKAREVTSGAHALEFVEANAEDTGLAAGSFDIISAVYLFHELPSVARERVVKEMARLIKPGGTVILTDTIQYGDEPGLDILLENFPRGFHEPYYDGYCRLDLETLFAPAGFKKVDETIGFLTKVVRFEKDE